MVDRSLRSDAPSGTKGSDRHRSHSDERGHRDNRRGSERRQESPRARHSPRPHESGERTRPSSSSGRSGSKSKQVDSTDLPESNRASGKATDVQPSTTHHHHHHPRASVDHRSLPSSSWASVDRRSLPEQHHHGRCESADKDQSGSSHVSRRDVEPPEKRTITVIQSPPRPVVDDDSAGVTGPADSAEVADSAEDQDLAGVDEPAVADDSADDADPAGWHKRRTRQVLPTQQIGKTRQLTTQQGEPAQLVRVPQLDLTHQISKDRDRIQP